MGHLIECGILQVVEGKKVLTEQAKNNFLETVQNILEYGSDGIPEDKKPFLQSQIKIPPGQQPIPDLKDEKIFKDFHERYLGRYQKVANDLDVDSNYSIPPIVDPISIASSAFNTQLPDPGFPDGFLKYFSPEGPAVLLGDLINAGVTDLASPTGLATLMNAILEKVKPPQIPNVQIPDILPPTPPVIDFTIPELPETSEIPQIPGVEFTLPTLPLPPLPTPPAPPQVSLSTVSAKELAIVQNLPKLLADIISKVPALISKIANPKELMDTVISSVLESGVMGDSKPTSTIEQAADAVLATKIAEMTLTASLASTIGSGPGSLTTSITQMTSGPRPTFRYISPPIPKVKPPPDLTPRQKAVYFANGIGDARYSNAEQRTSYLNALFPRETILANSAADKGSEELKINIFGKFIDESSGGPPYDSIAECEFNPTQTSGETLRNDTRLKVTPVPDITGFRRAADYCAEKQSSCGMFLRAAFFHAGCTNRFFTGFYPNTTAIDALKLIGFIRNFRWVGERDEETGNLKTGAAPGIIDDLWDYDVDGNPIDLSTLDPASPPANIDPERIKNARKLRENLNILQNKGSDKKELSDAYGALLRSLHTNFIGKGNIPGSGKSATDAANLRNFMEKYLKPVEKKAFIYIDELKTIGPLQFKLEAGDGMLIASPYSKSADEYRYGTEHAILAVESLTNGFKINEKGLFDPPFKTVEGGAIDSDNWGRDNTGRLMKKSFKIEVGVGKIRTYKEENEFVNKFIIADRKDGKYQTDGSYDYNADPFVEVTGTATYRSPFPTAILSSYRVMGAHEVAEGKHKYYTSGNRILGLDKEKIKQEIVASGGTTTWGYPREKRIIGIFNVDEYCNPIENFNDPKDKKKSASKAVQEMEKFVVLKKLVEGPLSLPSLVRLTAYFCVGGNYDKDGKLTVTEVNIGKGSSVRHAPKDDGALRKFEAKDDFTSVGADAVDESRTKSADTKAGEPETE